MAGNPRTAVTSSPQQKSTESQDRRSVSTKWAKMGAFTAERPSPILEKGRAISSFRLTELRLRT
jgi:hypothetical protein